MVLLAAAKIMTTIGLIAPLPFSCCLAECIRVFITRPLQQFRVPHQLFQWFHCSPPPSAQMAAFLRKQKGSRSVYENAPVELDE